MLAKWWISLKKGTNLTSELSVRGFDFLQSGIATDFESGVVVGCCGGAGSERSAAEWWSPAEETTGIRVWKWEGFVEEGGSTGAEGWWSVEFKEWIGAKCRRVGKWRREGGDRGMRSVGYGYGHGYVCWWGLVFEWGFSGVYVLFFALWNQMWTFMCYFDNAIKIKFPLVVVDFLFFVFFFWLRKCLVV